MGDVRLGTSGWSYAEWIGPVYDDEKQSKLRRYSSVFGIAEIDSTFYAYPSKGTVIGWNRNSPADFAYAAKLPKVVTHNKKLGLNGDVEDDLYKFCDLMEPLSNSGKLACLLAQLPPSLGFDLEVMGRFLELVPKGFRLAVEFRHPSWLRDETWRLLSDHNVAYTTVDEPLLPPDLWVTADFSYFRWHGHGRRPWYNYRYSLDELEPWVPKIREAGEKCQNVYGFFNNHYHGYAVENCLQVMDMLGQLTEQQSRALKKVQKWLTDHPPGAEPRARMRKLLATGAPEKRSDLEVRLLSFTDESRLERARGIKDDNVQILEITPNRITSRIRDYRVVVDLDGRQILHDCPDWARESRKKRFCKHVARLFLTLQPSKASEALTKIEENIEDWTFGQSRPPRS